MLIPSAVSDTGLFVRHLSVWHVALVDVKDIYRIKVNIRDLVNDDSDLFTLKDIDVFKTDVSRIVNEDSHRSWIMDDGVGNAAKFSSGIFDIRTFESDCTFFCAGLTHVCYFNVV